jgi:putative ABC transport system permease protein
VTTLSVRMALRRLWRFRGSTVVSIALLGLGIGAATAVFSVADSYVFQPMFPGQDRLYVFWPELSNGNRVEISYPEFFEWKTQLKSFSSLSVMWSSTMKRVVRRGEVLDVVPFRWVSASFFDTLGVPRRSGGHSPLKMPIPGWPASRS